MNKYIVSCLSSLMFASFCFGTEQIPDNIYFHGKLFTIDRNTFLLEEYWSDEHPRPDSLSRIHSPRSTALHRRYIATWELADKLYLKSLRTYVYPDGESIPLNTVFPRANGPVAANWFSGVLEFSRKDEHWYVSCDRGKKIGAKKLNGEQYANVRSVDMNWAELADKNNTATFRQDLETDPNLIGSAEMSKELLLKMLQRGFLPENKSLPKSPELAKLRQMLFPKKMMINSEFSFRGLHFPVGKVWLAPDYHLQVKLPTSVDAPKRVLPVQIKGTYRYRKNTEDIIIDVSEIKVLPKGSVIQKGAKSNQTLEGTR